MPRASLSEPRPAQALRLLVLWLCLWGGFLQATVGQAHVHAGVRSSDDPAAVQATPVVPADRGCLLCEIAGHSPGIAPPGSPLSLDPPAPVFRVSSWASRPELPGRRCHYWQGRAPPVLV